MKYKHSISIRQGLGLPRSLLHASTPGPWTRKKLLWKK